MAIVGDVFGLNAVYDRQVENVENDNFDSWPENLPNNPNFLSDTENCYFVGGLPTSSNLLRIDVSSETITDTSTNFPSTYYSTTSSNNFYGYAVISSTSTVDRLDFSNETVSSPGNDLPSTKSSLATTSSNSYGYFGGGQVPNPNSPPPVIYVSTITRLDFTNETASDPGNNLTAAVGLVAATESNSYGYYSGGIPSTSTIARLDFSNETVNELTDTLTEYRLYHSGVSSNSYGYFTGNSPANSTIDRLDFSSETINLLDTTMPSNNQRSGSINGDAFGFFLGGRNPSSPTVNFSTIVKFDFSSETTSNFGGNMPAARYYVAGFNKQVNNPVDSPKSVTLPRGRKVDSRYVKTAGYTTTYSPLPATTLLKYNMSGDTWSQLPSIAPGPGMYRGFGVNNNEYAYVSTQTNAGLFKFDLSSETNIGVVAYPLSSNYYVRGVSTREYGFMHNGASMGRMEFSTDTGSNYPAALPLGRNAQATMYSINYGYFAGGRSPDISNVQRWDFSTYVGTTLPPASNAPYGSSLFLVGNTNSKDAGYYFGGYNKSGVRRLDFSTEQNTTLTNMPGTSREGYCFSGHYDGYFGGGYQSGIPNLKIDYSTEGYSSVTSAPVSIYISHPFNNGL